VTLDPRFAEGWSSLGNLYHDLADWDRALAAHRRAVELAPALAQARWNRSFTLLATGDLGAGWDEYEWRFQTAAARPEPREFAWPRWQGESVAGRTILVWREQGIGDELLFLTCLGDLVRGGARVTLLASPRLVSLLERAFPDVEVLPDRPGAVGPSRRFDLQSPLASLPRWLRRHRSAFPPAGAFLVPDAGQQATWAARLETLGSRARIGFCWRSGLLTPERKRHYAPSSVWLEVLRTPGVAWVNLQYDDCDAELEAFEAETGIRVARWAGEDLRDDLESVTALVSLLDGVVTAPTAVGAIAGATGVPTWQVDSGSDWTAFGEETSPWFPTLRLVCPRAGESWEGIAARLARMLPVARPRGDGTLRSI
jgi:hypothetical protein